LKRTISRDRSRGAALVLSLFAVTIVAGMTMAFLRLGIATSSEQLQLVDQERSMAVAEAGLAEGLYALIRGGSGNVGSAALPAAYGDGLFWVGATGFPNGRTRLTATGMVGKGRAAVSQVWGENDRRRFFGGVMSETDIFIKSNAIVDSFDSRLGSYADQLPPGEEVLGDETIVMANEGIFFGSNGEVYGDVWAGYGFEADIPNVSGDLSQIRRPFALDPVEVPPIPIGAARTIGTDTVLPPGDYGLQDLRIDHNTTLEIVGPARIVVEDRFEMDKFSELIIDGTNGPVEIYVTSDTRVDVDSEIRTVYDDPHAVSMFISGGTGDPVDLRNHSKFYGSLYAPGIDLEIGTKWELFGAVAAGSIDTNPHTHIHTDTSLFDFQSQFTYTHHVWYEDALSNSAWTANRRDPFRMMGLDRNAMPSPDDAHDIHLQLGEEVDVRDGGDLEGGGITPGFEVKTPVVDLQVQ